MNGLYSDMLYIEDSTFSFLVIRPMEYLRRGILCAQLLWKKVMQNKVYNIHMDYDTKGVFIKEIDLNDVFSR